MPLYEYECEACGGRFEVIQKFADAPIEACRTCPGKVHRLLSAPAIQFKGTGWYITDYARKGKSGGDSSSTTTVSSSPSSSGSSSSSTSGSTSTTASTTSTASSGGDTKK
jgi:putative FmdB family regulatory protein